MEKSLYWYIGNLRILTNTYTTTLTTKQVARKDSIITNKDDLYKENARIKQRRMDIRKVLLVKSLRELLTITACLSQIN